MVFTEDLNAFLGDFGETVMVGIGIAAVPITAIFDNAHFAVTDAYAEISTVQPRITCKTSDIASYQQGTPVVVRGVNYYLVDHQPDGTGMSEVILHR